MNYNTKLNIYSHKLFIAIALVILVDFLLPGKVINDEVISVQKSKQQYYNAARNYHYSYEVITNKTHFMASKDFAQSVKKNQPIKYAVSRLFNEVNWYKSLKDKNKSIHSLRIFLGLIFPLLTIIAIVLMYRFNKKIGSLVMMLKIILIIDLIFLII